jgi:hypothetical protein
LTRTSKVNLILTMSIKQQTTYDLDTEQFKYLKREESINLNRVDINDLNKRLNKAKRSNFYTTTLIAGLSLFCLLFLIIISIKF